MGQVMLGPSGKGFELGCPPPLKKNIAHSISTFYPSSLG